MLAELMCETTLGLAPYPASPLPGNSERVFFSETRSVDMEVTRDIAIHYWRNMGNAAMENIALLRHTYHGDMLANMLMYDPEEIIHPQFRGSMPVQSMAALPTDEVMRRTFDRLSEHWRRR